MKFLRISKQLAINTETIDQVLLVGYEGVVHLNVVSRGEEYCVKTFKTFTAAEIELGKLVNSLEGLTSDY